MQDDEKNKARTKHKPLEEKVDPAHNDHLRHHHHHLRLHARHHAVHRRRVRYWVRGRARGVGFWGPVFQVRTRFEGRRQVL